MILLYRASLLQNIARRPVYQAFIRLRHRKSVKSGIAVLRLIDNPPVLATDTLVFENNSNVHVRLIQFIGVLSGFILLAGADHAFRYGWELRDQEEWKTRFIGRWTKFVVNAIHFLRFGIGTCYLVAGMMIISGLAVLYPYRFITRLTLLKDGRTVSLATLSFLPGYERTMVIPLHMFSGHQTVGSRLSDMYLAFRIFGHKLWFFSRIQNSVIHDQVLFDYVRLKRF